jgi:hypothetical protein
MSDDVAKMLAAGDDDDDITGSGSEASDDASANDKTTAENGGAAGAAKKGVSVSQRAGLTISVSRVLRASKRMHKQRQGEPAAVAQTAGLEQIISDYMRASIAEANADKRMRFRPDDIDAGISHDPRLQMHGVAEFGGNSVNIKALPKVQRKRSRAARRKASAAKKAAAAAAAASTVVETPDVPAAKKGKAAAKPAAAAAPTPAAAAKPKKTPAAVPVVPAAKKQPVKKAPAAAVAPAKVAKKAVAAK